MSVQSVSFNFQSLADELQLHALNECDTGSFLRCLPVSGKMNGMAGELLDKRAQICAKELGLPENDPASDTFRRIKELAQSCEIEVKGKTFDGLVEELKEKANSIEDEGSVFLKLVTSDLISELKDVGIKDSKLWPRYSRWLLTQFIKKATNLDQAVCIMREVEEFCIHSGNIQIFLNQLFEIPKIKEDINLAEFLNVLIDKTSFAHEKNVYSNDYANFIRRLLSLREEVPQSLKNKIDETICNLIKKASGGHLKLWYYSQVKDLSKELAIPEKVYEAFIEAGERVEPKKIKELSKSFPENRIFAKKMKDIRNAKLKKIIKIIAEIIAIPIILIAAFAIGIVFPFTIEFSGIGSMISILFLHWFFWNII